MTPYTSNPGVSLFFAPFYRLALQFDADNWLPVMIGTGNQAAIVLIFVGFLLLYRELRGKSIFLFICTIIVWPFFLRSLYNASELMFATSTIFAFVSYLKWHRTGKYRFLALVSFFVGISTMMRNDGLVLAVCIFCELAYSFYRKRNDPKTIKVTHLLAAYLLPLLFIASGYFWISKELITKADTNISKRSYIAFEQGYYPSRLDYKKDLIQGQLESRKRFGLPEENNHSVIKAAIRHPKEFIIRVLRNCLTVPVTFVRAVDFNGSAIVTIPLILLGFLNLYKTNQFNIIKPIIVWFTIFTIYFFFFFRTGYFAFFFYIYITLLYYGIQSVKIPIKSNLTNICILSGLPVCLVLSQSVSWILLVVFLICDVIIYVTIMRKISLFTRNIVSLSIATLLVYAWSDKINFSRIPTRSTEEFKIVKILEQNVGPGNWIWCYGFREAVFANLVVVSFDADMCSINTQDKWLKYLNDYKPLRAAYLNPELHRISAKIYNFLCAQNGKSLNLKYQDETGLHRIYSVNRKYVQEHAPELLSKNK
ncbi:hypothetical protein K8T06_01235 [bacterium]|nr:hypothetical protein [bacterium]